MAPHDGRENVGHGGESDSSGFVEILLFGYLGDGADLGGVGEGRVNF